MNGKKKVTVQDFGIIKKSSIKSMHRKSSIKSVSLNIGTDPEDTILNAFKMFDPEAKGYIHTAE